MKKEKILALVITGLMFTSTVAYAKGNSQAVQNKGQQITQQEKSHSRDNGDFESQDKNNSDQDKDNYENQMKNNNSSNQGNEDGKKHKNEENRDNKKQQIQAFKSEMKAKHATMKQIRQQTIALKQQIAAKKSQLQAIINDIEAGKKTLPQDMLDTLLSKAANLKIDSEKLKATDGVNKDVADTQDKVNKKDFNNALSSLDKVIAKLQARLDALKTLNADLDDVLAIANQATTPAPTPTQTTTPAAPTAPTDSAAPTDNQTTTNGSSADSTANSNTTTNTSTTTPGSTGTN